MYDDPILTGGFFDKLKQGFSKFGSSVSKGASKLSGFSQDLLANPMIQTAISGAATAYGGPQAGMLAKQMLGMAGGGQSAGGSNPLTALMGAFGGGTNQSNPFAALLGQQQAKTNPLSALLGMQSKQANPLMALLGNQVPSSGVNMSNLGNFAGLMSAKTNTNPFASLMGGGALKGIFGDVADEQFSLDVDDAVTKGMEILMTSGDLMGDGPELAMEARPLIQTAVEEIKEIMENARELAALIEEA